VAGIAANMASCIFHPLENVKVRFQGKLAAFISLKLMTWLRITPFLSMEGSGMPCTPFIDMRGSSVCIVG
jgi:hypothetical protein